MSTASEVRVRGVSALVEALVPVEAELLREPFDYTQWQRSLWAERGVYELSQAAMTLR